MYYLISTDAKSLGLIAYGMAFFSELPLEIFPYTIELKKLAVKVLLAT